jgi:hypothetical protein
MNQISEGAVVTGLILALLPLLFWLYDKFNDYSEWIDHKTN